MKGKSSEQFDDYAAEDNAGKFDFSEDVDSFDESDAADMYGMDLGLLEDDGLSI